MTRPPASEPKPRTQFRYKIRYFVMMYVPVLIFFSLTCYGLFRRDYIEIIDEIGDSEYQIIQQNGRNLQYFLALIQSDIRQLSRQPAVVEVVNDPAGPSASGFEAIENLVGQRQLYDEMMILDRSGNTLLHTNYEGNSSLRQPDASAPLRSMQDYFRQPMQSPQSSIYVSDIDLRDPDGNLTDDSYPTLRFAVPLFTNQSERWGVLVLTMDLRGLLGALEAGSANNRGELWLLNQAGYWLASPNADYKWGNFLPGRETANLATRYPEFWASFQQNQLGNLRWEGSLFSYTHICADLTCQHLANQPLLANLARDEFAPSPYWTIASFIPAAELSLLNVLLPEYERWLIIALSLLLVFIPSTYVVWKLATSLVALRYNEVALRDSMLMHEAFFERNPTIMFVKDVHGNYLMANKSCRDFADASGSMVGTSHHSIFPQDDAVIIDDQEATVLEYKQPMEFNTKLKGKAGYQYFTTLRFPMRDNDGRVIGIGGIANDMTDQIKARKALRDSETQFRTLLETAPVAVILTDTRGRISLVNQYAEDLFGYDRRTLASKKLKDLLPEIDLHELDKLNLKNLDYKEFHKVSASLAHRQEGTTLLVEVSLSATATESGIAITCLVQDVSDRARLEAQLRQSQKMEAIGKLTGGMAHDFNNLLGVIIGNLDLAARKLDLDSPGYKRLETAKRAAERGAELTKRMLAVARRQALQPKPTDINSMIVDLTEMLPRTLGPDIEMACDLAEDLPPVLVDHSGLENVLLNLALNSRDAMPHGGKFFISTDVRSLSQEEALATQDDMKPGRYVHITVTDTGDGMDADTLSRAFEPFFTTKARGKGTGLGLAMIYGFAKQSGGNVRMVSSPGAGTTIELLLPIVPGIVVEKPVLTNTSNTDFRFSANDVILVVDDETALLEVAIFYLEEMGCRVLSATNGEQALQILAHNSEIRLLLTDIVMPGGINGVELAKRAKITNTDIRVLYTSGFPEGVLADKSGLRLDAPLLEKPYSKIDLGRAVRKALGYKPTLTISPPEPA